jgi:aminoglycoside phosphotransferase (APT) family kinase protein
MDRGELQRLLGMAVESVEAGEWGFTNRTAIATLADGRRLVVQQYADRAGAANRLRSTRRLAGPLREVGVPTSVLVQADLAATPPYAVFEALPGQPGYVAADHDLSAPVFPAMAAAMGRLLVDLRSIPAAGLGLPSLWASPVQLAATASRWLATSSTVISTTERNQLQAVIDSLPELFVDRPVVVAHGDYGPANVLFEGDRVTGLLDFESARLADPLFDVAWWSWLLRFHTPDAFEAGWPRFLAAARIDADEPGFERRIFVLLMVRLLETTFSYSAADTHAAWGERISRTLGWDPDQ